MVASSETSLGIYERVKTAEIGTPGTEDIIWLVIVAFIDCGEAFVTGVNIDRKTATKDNRTKVLTITFKRSHKINLYRCHEIAVLEIKIRLKAWFARRDSNPEPSDPKSDALSS